ncbi:hypothetical protein AAFC00_002076 [Neodothiora populina]|uniref:EthD domain-containing protein n=1 Tax=Neodothiora populina TaxID=2781224 RepID=A0ABR3PGH6_9PEZI
MASAKVLITILYPVKEGSTFNLEYYTTKHMPLAKEIWGSGSDGLLSSAVYSLDPSSGFVVQTVTGWKDMAAFQAAMTHERSKELIEDVKNFCEVEPKLLVGNLA